MTTFGKTWLFLTSVLIFVGGTACFLPLPRSTKAAFACLVLIAAVVMSSKRRDFPRLASVPQRLRYRFVAPIICALFAPFVVALYEMLPISHATIDAGALTLIAFLALVLCGLIISAATLRV